MKEGWETKRLGELLQKTETVNPLKAPEDEFEYIDVSSVSNKTFQIESTQLIKGKDAPSRAKKRVRAGDVIFATIRPTLQRTAVVPEYLDGQVCSTGYTVLRPKEGFDQKFVFYFLFTGDFADAMERLQRGASYPAVTDGDVRNQEIAVPPLPEQKRIVAKLDEAFEGIAKAKENTERNVANARAIFESELNAIFTKKGEGWEEKRLEEICSFSSGGTPSKKNQTYWEGDIPWVSGRDMKSTRLSNATLHVSQRAVDESATRIAPVGSLLTLVRGMGLAHGAQVAEVIAPCAFNQDIKAIHPKAGVVSRYLLFALKIRINTKDTILSSAAHGTLRLDTEGLKNILVPLPKQEKQEEIISKVDGLSNETKLLESIYQRKLSELDALKQSLLHRAFTGQL